MRVAGGVRAGVVCLAVVASLMPGLARSTQAQSDGSLVSPPPPAPPAPSIARPIAQDIVALNTTARLARFDAYFRLTHRFARDLRGPIGDLAKSAFGLDDGAIIGFELRFAPASRLQVGAHRSMLQRTIQIFGRYDAVAQTGEMPVGVSVLAAIEGTNNLRDAHAPSAGAVLSRVFGGRLAVYFSPIVVWHPDERTFMGGVGARVSVRPTVFVAGEFMPRAGFTPGAHQWAAAIEKRTDGHQFQLNVSNSFSTTNAQIARGGQPGNVYLGFNLARRF